MSLTYRNFIKDKSIFVTLLVNSKYLMEYSRGYILEYLERLRFNQASNHQCGLAVALNEKSLPPPPEFIKHREELWNKLKREYDGFVASQPRSPVQITLPDGTIVDGKAWETTPMEVAKNIRSNSLVTDLFSVKSIMLSM
ncbi:uncharacterized protein DC041_0013037 [Schistosoma bovis]|uniref:TGS domain-containing protein n=1 Tax=Schistosoma bovis TaxID=6184 RepID=A0A430QAC8_SCHBO|nr:uncharacterized protein DC041_0013037 [Schistosoma bovis]